MTMTESLIENNLKNAYGAVILLVRLLAEPCNFFKSDTSMGVFTSFNCINGIKLCKASKFLKCAWSCWNIYRAKA